MANPADAAKRAVEAIRWGALQKHDELEMLGRFLAKRRHPRVVVEVGTANGGTLWFWCQYATHDALLISVDLPGGDFGGGYTVQDVPRLLGHARAGQDIQLLAGNSHSGRMLEAVEELLDGRMVDLLFIDGDHTYEGVKQDWQMYSPLVGPGGLIIFHDIVEHDEIPECQVDRLWNELKSEHKHEEFCAADRGWAGIGVIHA
jgi:predicted O-methyltransferase YrrM